MRLALFHLWLSMITLAILCIAGLQAILLAIQERLLRLSPSDSFIQKLPPLVTMEKFLFQTIVVGFILLSLLLGSSFYEFHGLLWQHLLWQKIVLVMIAWAIFVILLMGRYGWGWRGRKAIYGTFFGVLLVVIVYVGSQFIMEGWH